MPLRSRAEATADAPLADGPEEVPRCAKDAAEEEDAWTSERASTRRSARLSTAASPLSARVPHSGSDSSHQPPAARARKPSRLQHALLDAQEQLQRVASAGSSRMPVERAHPPQTAPGASSSASPLRGDANELALARDAVQRVVSKFSSVPWTDPPAHARLLRALDSELPFSIESATQRHETDVRCWYAVGKAVGSGTFGRVSSARHRLSETRVAIKSYFRERGASVCCRAPPASARSSSSGKKAATSADDALDWKRVRHEAKMLAALRPHASVVRFVEAFETPTQLHIVMEFAAGETLVDFLQLHGLPSARGGDARRLGEPRARAIFAQLCAAVASLHDQHVIHRDLKLENVLVDALGRAKVIDLGFSQFDRSAGSKRLCGTPAYMAPEVVACASYDGKRADVWSLGVVLYVLLCGRFPFAGVTFQQLYQSTRTSPCAFPSPVSREAQALVRSILVVDPSKRPGARDLLEHPWMRAREATTTRVDSSFVIEWCRSEAAARICAALEQIHGLDASALLLAVREKRRNGATALVRLALLAVENEFAALALGASEQLTNSFAAAEGRTEAPSASAHRQYLEGLIELARASSQSPHRDSASPT